jgi:hypothetical protein
LPDSAPQDPLLGFLLVRVPRRNINEVDCKEIRAQDFSGMTAAVTTGLVFLGKMLAGARARRSIGN